MSYPPRPYSYPEKATRRLVIKQELWRSLACRACRAPPGSGCLHCQDTKTGARGEPRPPHPARILSAIAEDWTQRVQAWDLSPAGVAHATATEAWRAKESRRFERRMHHAAELEAKKQAAAVIHKQRAAEQRTMLRSDGITMRARVLTALIRIGGEGSAWKVAVELGLEDSLLGAVHGGLLACVKRGEVTREIVPSFVPSHSYRGGTSSVYRVDPAILECEPERSAEQDASDDNLDAWTETP